MTDLEHLQAFVVTQAEAYFGCPIAQTTIQERNEWANRNSTCKRQMDVLRQALYEAKQASGQGVVNEEA